MKAPPRPPDEIQRLEALRRFECLDTPPDPEFDDLATLAANICETPISLISLVDANRQWFKSSVGMSDPETPRDISFCGHAILGSGLFTVHDAAKDDRFADNPLVRGEPGVRFYAGEPLVSSDGYALGALCVMDRVPRELTGSQRDALRVLARQVIAQMERRRHTAELVDSERRLFQVFEGCPVGLSVTRWPDRTFVDVNASFTAMLGWTRDELIGRTAVEVGLIDDADAARVRTAITPDGRLRDVELTVRTRTGESRKVLLSAERLELRREPHVISTFVDITARKVAEAELLERDEQLRLYAEHSPAAIAMFNRDMRYLVVSRGWMETYRLGRASVIGRSHYEVFPDLPQRWKEVHRRCLAGAIERCDEDPFRRSDGGTDWIRWEIRPWRQADGSIGGVIIFSEDITERKQRDAALRASEERMRFALESANVGIWDLDYVTGVVRWSPILEAQCGYEPGTFPGTFDAFISRVHPEDRHELTETITSAVKSGKDFRIRHRVIRPDGTVRWLSGAGRVHLDKHGNPVRGVGISIDDTERHTLEEQYDQAQKMEAVGRLAGGVAHDFNNLLTAILGYCDLLLNDQTIGDERRHDVMEIAKAGTTAAGLTRQLLAFSRKQIIEPVLIDLNATISTIHGMLGRLLGEDLTVVLKLDPDLAPIKADRSQIDQILMNLAVNARDAMPRGGTLTIATANVAPSRVVLTVADTGTGMPPEVKAHLFEPFFTTKEQGKGTGLGLATVHGIVGRMGGTIRVDTEVGKGTSFVIYLPRAEGATAATPSREVAVAAPRPQEAKTILVVEDAESIRRLATRILEPRGYRVLAASNADEAMEIFKDNPDVDLVLTDIVMPGASGPELTRALIEAHPGLRILYMSGYTTEKVAEHGVLQSGIAFLHKPFTPETLSRKVSEVLS